MKGPREYRDLIERAKSQGWTLHLSGGGHLVWQSPTGVKVFSASSPSDHRAVKNVKRDLKRYGMRFDD